MSKRLGHLPDLNCLATHKDSKHKTRILRDEERYIVFVRIPERFDQMKAKK
ncbi:hypothetical protein SLEP1_g14655 [Rubroshorea leprosula]|uniref:Uncharacterized protein n=1 Tax=Rubroshorea leprosula TaxID=152421 RepID=A0AAV5ISQ2_9ROSI|nr:hypothetical protein SLEP1_g14655 [Rubroshorea leprosula]